MQLSTLQISSFANRLEPVPQSQRNDVSFSAAQNGRALHEVSRTARDGTWRPSGLAHPEAEAFLSNVAINVDWVGTRPYWSSDDHANAASGSIQLFFVLDGHGICRSNGAEFPVHSGTLLVALNLLNLEFFAAHPSRVFANGEHRTARSSGGDQLTLACISLSLASASDGHIFEQLDRALVNHNGCSHIRQTVELLIGEVDRQHIGARSIVESLAKNLLLLAMREHFGQAHDDGPLRGLLSEPQIARVVNAIKENPGRRYTMESLAQLAAMTPQALSRRFESLFAMAPNEYVLHARLVMAEALLRSTNLPVKTIAGKVGFASRSHFSRLFSKYSGRDPTAYRNEQQ